MEIKGEDGGIISIQSGSKRDCGRGVGFPSDDPTVSRRHISFHLPDSAAHQHNNRKTQDSGTGLHFEALGKNPVWVLDGGSGEIRVFRKSEKGVLRVGDCFCVSANKPVLYTVKKSAENDKVETKMKGLSELENRLNEEDMARDEDLGSGSVDISQIDPLKEFGFLVLGHEFDNYPKTMIRDMKDWDWFLEEEREDNETDDDTERSRSKGKKGVRRKKKTEVNDDEWTGESEDEKVAISSFGRGKRPRYNTTRSNDSSKPLRDTRSKAKLKPTKIVRKRKDEENEEDEEEEDDDEDETLGGFIVVSDEDPEKDEEDEEEEEEELEDDEEDNDEDEMDE